ncbi:MAG TPA: PGF-CTERM sorting domain-containing protein, partial [Methanocorpusculum sp.]|nr:PGF-CTERM sorting domain-containing protein [Methanocorpusculum sp.]
VVKGPNALQGSQAAYALEQMLQSPNIPDLSQTFTFTIAYPTITINPIGTQYMGVPFTVSGTTNLAAGDTLLVSVQIATFWPMGKEEANAEDAESWSQGDSGSVTVQQGASSGQNYWSFSVNPLHSSQYDVTVTGIKTGATASQEFSVSNQSKPTTVPTTAVTTAVTTAATTVPAPTQSPGFGLAAAAGALGAVVFLTYRRH